jgi:hypothetical protein
MLDFSHAFYERMSTNLLAKQPVTLSNIDEVFHKNWDTVYSQLESLLSSDRTWRYSWWQHWNRLATYFLPFRDRWFVTPNKTNKGSPINDAIIDSTGLMAARTCASGFFTGVMDPSKSWFKLGIGSPGSNVDSETQAWLDDTQEKAYIVLAQSNFYTKMAQACHDLVVFGTCPVIIYEDLQDVIRLYLPCAGEYFLRTGARLDIDTFSREFTLTVCQIVDMFDIENCPLVITQLWNQGGGALNNEFVVAHTIAPNIAMNNRKGESFFAVPHQFSYKEVYWLRGMKTDRPLSKRGFHNKPFVVARWSEVSNDPYGRCATMDCLGDNKELQMATLRKAEHQEKCVRPPMGGDPELKNQPASQMPGSLTYCSTEGGKKGFWPLYQVNPAAENGLLASIKEVQERIKACLFVPVFMAITQMEGVQPRNELELNKRDQERLQSLGPVIELFQSEFAGPAIERLIDIMEKKNLLLPRPKSMQNGAPLKISYMSLMKAAQKGAQAVSVKDYLATMGGASSAAKAAGIPDPLRIVNLDNLARVTADIMNLPEKCLYSPDEVHQHDAIREKMLAQQKQQAQAPALAMAGVQAAKTLSDTKVPGGSALGAMLGSGPGG